MLTELTISSRDNYPDKVKGTLVSMKLYCTFHTISTKHYELLFNKNVTVHYFVYPAR